MAGERLRVTVSGRDAADLVPIEESPWTSGERAWSLINGYQADPALARELDEAFPETTDDM
jgi:antitoxin (DNA-binding transcriptional repressor) of toxin-antitoxin stability system